MKKVIGIIRTLMALPTMIQFNLKWHHLNRNTWHGQTEMAGTIRTVMCIYKISNILVNQNDNYFIFLG